MLCKLVFSISDARECAAQIWLFFFFHDTKLSPTEVGMKRLYEFKYCFEFISAVCLKLQTFI